MSDKPKHTPGPWYADRNGHIWRRPPDDLYENGGGVAGDKPVAIAIRGWYNDGETGYPVVANAQLIAAAPEMIEALIAQERADWARRNYESISCDPLHPDREALSLEMIQTMSHAATLRKEAISKAKP